MSIKYTLKLQGTGYGAAMEKSKIGTGKNKKQLTFKFFFNSLAWI